MLITGASSGIGEAIARRYAQAGANLVLSARRLERLESLAAELTSARQKAVAVVGDVSRDGDMERVVSRALAEFGRVDVVVANAGFSVGGRLEKLSLEDYRRQFEVNVFGVLRTIYASLAELKKNRGRLVLIGSVAGSISLPQSSAYCMSKFALAGLSDALASELGSSGVSTTLIMPGFIDTEIFDVSNRNEPVKSRGKDRPPRFLLMPAGQAADQIVRAADARKRHKIITLHGKLMVFLNRCCPGLVNLVLKRMA